MKYLCLLVITLSGCSKPSEEAKAPDPIAEVRTATAQSGTTVSTITAYGAVEADLAGSTSLVAEREAVLARIEAANGTQVRAGQVIAVLRASPLATLDAVKSANEVRAASAVLARAVRLRSDGLASDADVETARTAVSAARATRTSLNTSQASLVLRAPTKGVVQNLTLRPGDQIAAGTTVATVAAAGHLRARFGLDPLAVQAVHVGQPIRISQLKGGEFLDASVSGIDTQVDATTRLASVFAKLPRDYDAGPGVPLKANIRIGSRTASITIPYAALLDGGGKSYIFVVESGVAHRKDVVDGSADGDRVSVTSGLKPGEHVVIEGGTALEDGMRVHEKASGK